MRWPYAQLPLEQLLVPDADVKPTAAGRQEDAAADLSDNELERWQQLQPRVDIEYLEVETLSGVLEDPSPTRAAHDPNASLGHPW
jgi:hypothetical protein